MTDTRPPSYLLMLREQEALANKNLVVTQAEIAKIKYQLAALEKHHYEHEVIAKKVAWFAQEKGVSFDEMMAQYAWNRLIVMRKHLDTLRSM